MMTPLTLAILLAILVLNVALSVAALLLDYLDRGTVAISIGIWFGLPWLFALGVAPTLVGNEQESGTLGWLRTLPVSWTRLTNWKLAVSIAGLLLVWAAATMMLGLQFLLHSDSFLNGLDIPELDSKQVFLAGLVFVGISFWIWACSFCCSFWFRSPMAAVVGFFPAFFAVVLGNGYILERVSVVPPIRVRSAFVDLPMSAQYKLVAIPVTIFLVLVGLLYLLAWMRLNGKGGYEGWLKRSKDAFELHDSISPMRMNAPSIHQALIWQQLRHISPYVLPMIVLSLVGCVFGARSVNTWRNDAEIFWVMSTTTIVALTAHCIGGLTFFSDNLRQRVAFFADRGISPTRLWATRVLVSACFLGLLLGCVAVGLRIRGHNAGQLNAAWIMIPLSIAWATGVLISMVSRRPVLGLFGGLALSMFWPALSGWFYTIYQTYAWTLLFSVAVLLFAGWRLCRRWLDGRTGRPFEARVAAYIALAIGLPMAVTLVHRYATLPSVDQQWRSRMLATELPRGNSDLSNSDRTTGSASAWTASISTAAFLPRFYDSYHFGNTATGIWHDSSPISDSDESLAKRMERELASVDRIGVHVSGQEITSLLPPTLPIVRDRGDMYRPTRYLHASALEIQAVEVLLHWANRSRRLIVEGDEGMATLVGVAEPAERIAVAVMFLWSSSAENQAEIDRLQSLIADDDLRKESRRVAIVGHWKRFVQLPWTTKTGLGKEFAFDRFLAPHVAWLNVEQRRSERWVDQAIQILLDEIESGRLFAGDPNTNKFTKRWVSAMKGPPRIQTKSNGNRGARTESANSTMIQWVGSLSYHQQQIEQLQRGPAR